MISSGKSKAFRPHNGENLQPSRFSGQGRWCHVAYSGLGGVAWAAVLARWPRHVPSAQHMQVEMIDSLSAVPARIDHNTEAVRSMLLADLGSAVQQMPEHLGICLLYMRQ